MITKYIYICEICKTKFDVKQDAINCEAKGIPVHYPVGLLFSTDSVLYGLMAFSVANSVVVNHARNILLWACRDTKAGDSLGKETCTSGWLNVFVEFQTQWLSRPTVQRMVNYLRSEGIEPLVIVDGEYRALMYL